MPFADDLLGLDAANALVQTVQDALPAADLPHLREAAASLSPLALRERADLLRDALLADLPGDYDSLARTVRAAHHGSAEFTGWLIWPVTAAVAHRAVAENTDAAFNDSMGLLAELTPRLTSEFAIRTLLRHNLPRALAIAGQWTLSPDPHVRRLASEGTRPYLPWAVRVPALLESPDATIALLDALYRDDSDYVRRSVANHLNDLSRDHPELVVTTARRWLANPGSTTPGVVRHGLRTLIKKGDQGALELLGFGAVSLAVSGPTLAQSDVPFGGSIDFHATVRNVGSADAALAIDYIVHHNKANGLQTGKTFKLMSRVLAPGASLELAKTHSFRAITTRRYHAGAHAVELQINGVRYGRTEFLLRPPG